VPSETFSTVGLVTHVLENSSIRTPNPDVLNLASFSLGHGMFPKQLDGWALGALGRTILKLA
jgi:hypothetical protein